MLLRLALFNNQKDKRRELTLKYNQRGSFRLNLQASIYKGAENYVLFQHIAHLQSCVSRKRFHQGRINVWQCPSILPARGPCPPPLHQNEVVIRSVLLYTGLKVDVEHISKIDKNIFTE